MIEYHGWIVVRESFDEKGEDDEKLHDLFRQVQNKIQSLHKENEFYDLRYLNGTLHLSIQGNHNHRDEQLLDFYKWVAQNAIGSYGLLYVYDEEDRQRENGNKFKVWRMKKGQVDELDDVYLSPYFPTVEEM
ncbi:MAG: hypothetical protein HOP30_22015 [Cyclobacteriaceae bacterium]|nr:hypothetical protein [Cyclobacteriaceae bacterium]